jgi:uncharacterized membrane protein
MTRRRVTEWHAIRSYRHELGVLNGGGLVRSLYIWVLVTHVLVAVLGLGSIASVAIVAATARRTGRSSAGALTSLGPLLRYSGLSLVAMLATGILLGITGGAVHEAWWFRASALLLVPTGVLHAQARRAVRRGLANEDDGDMVLQRVERRAYGMCAIIAVIAVLMEAKPF